MLKLNRSFLLAALALPLVVSSTAFADSSCGSVAGNLISNCGFETGTFSSWTEVDNTLSTGVDKHNPHTGSYAADMGAYGTAGTLSQKVTDVAGAVYNVQFFLENEMALQPNGQPYPGGNTFEVSITNDLNQTTDLMSPTTIPQSSSYADYMYTFTATGMDTLTFTFDNEPSYYDLDDVSIAQPTPEPSSLLLMGTGVMAFAVLARRKMNFSANDTI